MKSVLRTVAGLSAAAMMGLAPVAALADTSIGMYQTTDRKMDYDLRLCGADQKHLCVELVAARGSALTKQTRPFVGKDIVHNAKPAGKNKWAGSVHIQGYTMDGNLVLSPGKKFVMSGCTMLVICADFMLIPAKK